MVGLIWEGKYDADGTRTVPLRLQVPLHTVETVNQSAQERQMSLAVLCKTRGALPPSKWKAMSPTRSQAGGRPAVGVTTTFRRKAGLRPRALRLAAAVGVGKAGRRVVFVCARAAVGYNWGRRAIACASDSAGMADTGLITEDIGTVQNGICPLACDWRNRIENNIRS